MLKALDKFLDLVQLKALLHETLKLRVIRRLCI